MENNRMRYIFANQKTAKFLDVKEYSKMFGTESDIILDNIVYIVKDISIDLLNNKTFIYVENK
jgi:hypothetical protein